MGITSSNCGKNVYTEPEIEIPGWYLGPDYDGNDEWVSQDVSSKTEEIQWAIQVPFVIFFAIILSLVRLKCFKLTLYSFKSIKFITQQSMAIATGFTSIISTYSILTDNYKHCIFEGEKHSDDFQDNDNEDGAYLDGLVVLIWFALNALVLLITIYGGFKMGESKNKNATKWLPTPCCCKLFDVLFSSFIMFGLSILFNPLVELIEAGQNDDWCICSRTYPMISAGMVTMIMSLAVVPMLFISWLCWLCCRSTINDKGEKQNGCCCGCLCVGVYRLFYYLGALLASGTFIVFRIYDTIQNFQDVNIKIKFPATVPNVYITVCLILGILSVIFIIAIYFDCIKKKNDEEKEGEMDKESMPKNKPEIVYTVQLATMSQHIDNNNPITTITTTATTPTSPVTAEYDETIQTTPVSHDDGIEDHNESVSISNNDIDNVWTRRYTDDGRIYYQNEITKMTQWEAPTNLDNN